MLDESIHVPLYSLNVLPLISRREWEKILCLAQYLQSEKEKRYDEKYKRDDNQKTSKKTFTAMKSLYELFVERVEKYRKDRGEHEYTQERLEHQKDKDREADKERGKSDEFQSLAFHLLSIAQ